MTSRSLTILGSTGSVGCATLDVVAHLRATAQEDMRIVALTAARNIDLLAAQAIKFNAAFAAVADPALGPALAALLAGTGIRTGAGPQAIIDAAAMESSMRVVVSFWETRRCAMRLMPCLSSYFPAWSSP